MLTHTGKYCKVLKITANTTKYCIILQKYYKILQDTAKYYQILQQTTKFHTAINTFF
jgi:hypothetical protein